MKYRNGAGVVDAIQWNGYCVDELSEMLGDEYELLGACEKRTSDGEIRACWKYVAVETLFGETRAHIGDYIIKKDNRLFVISPDTFIQFYYAA